jgi:hypothetical protein
MSICTGKTLFCITISYSKNQHFNIYYSSLCLYVRLPFCVLIYVRMPICLCFVCSSVLLAVFALIRPSVCLSVVCQSICLSTCPFVCPLSVYFVQLSVRHLSVCTCTCLPFGPSVFPTIYLFFCL